ncbi:MAG: AI-2E family transporter [Flavobacteriales bacterium]
MNENPNTNNSSQNSFSKKVWITAGIFSFTVLIILFLIKTINSLLLILAGALIAIFFIGLSLMIERKTGWKRGICKAISVIGTLLLAISFFWLMGAKVQAQFSELSETIPETITNAKKTLEKSTFGEKVLETVTSEESLKKAQVFGGQFFQSTFGVFGDLYVVLFIAIFFTVNPNIYTRGLITLVPERGQAKAEEISKKLGEQLRNWLKGKLFSMFIVFVFTAIGLTILGLDLWLVLALLAGLLSFVPNFGPLIALIPALLIGLMDGTQTALIVLGIYVLVQFLESNFITPLVQQKLIKMPPAMILIAQLLMGALTGGWGLILATPITVIVIVMVQELYLNQRNSM